MSLYAHQKPVIMELAESWRHNALVRVERLLPTAEAEDLLALVREIADRELAPRAQAGEEAGEYPRDLIRLMGNTGLLGLAFPGADGGGDQPYEVYLQVLEELAARWVTVALTVSVHTLASWPVSHRGDDAQRAKWLPEMLGGQLLGAFCLSEPEAGSDAAALSTRAVRDGDTYVLTGTKAWVTHGGVADFYTVFARTSDDRAQGISCFLVPGEADGLRFGAPERKMGLSGSPTTQLHLDEVRVSADRLIGVEGAGLEIAMGSLDCGRMGVAAVATGLAQAALAEALAYAKERTQFGKPIVEHEGLRFTVADMAAGVASSRAAYLDAARRHDRGMPFRQAASIAKLVATDNAMRVTTDAVQVLGGAGYTREFPVERYFREAKVMQIFEGTNEIQRLVIARHLATS